MNQGEVLFEFLRFGGMLRVTAVDPATGTEATILAHPGPERSALEALALRKLRYLQSRDVARL